MDESLEDGEVPALLDESVVLPDMALVLLPAALLDELVASFDVVLLPLP